uniref:InlB B-repeat-containing protein n=1 Tax=Vaginimicrobium propionicum TaxID=1871034 RepID=UPI0009710D17|nr:InlB B-repeat-containing protein [Vaginimicrobium propionicum]
MAFQFTGSAYAADVAIDATNFPDANFRNYVSTELDTNSDGILQQSEANAATEINVTNRSITSLKGVEHFTKLTTLNASNEYNGNNNRLAAVDLSHNTNLTELDLSYNDRLTAVDLKANTNLTKLNLASNKFAAVDLSANTNLDFLDLSRNQLTAVDLSANTHLGRDCHFDQSRAVRLPRSSRLVPVNQLSAEFDAGKVRNLKGATIVDGRLKVDEGASKVTYDYDTDNGRYRLMPVTLQVMVAQVYSVSFDMGGHGSQVAAQSVFEGELASAPAAPTAEGWEFKGWYTDNTFATAFDFTKPINADVTVYAKWEKAGGEPTTQPTAEPSGQPTTQPTVVKVKKVPKTGGESSFGFAGVGAVVAAGVAAGWLFRRRNA